MSEADTHDFGPTVRSVYQGGIRRCPPGLSQEVWDGVRVRLHILHLGENTLTRTAIAPAETLEKGAAVFGLSVDTYANAVVGFMLDWAGETRDWLLHDDETAPLRAALRTNPHYLQRLDADPWRPEVIANAIEFAIGTLTGEIEAQSEE